MKKGIFLSLMVFTSQLYGYQPTDDSTFIFADLLVWQFRAGSADNWAQEITPTGPTQTAKLFGVPFNWKPGLRLGVGQNNCYGDWDTVFSYTGFQTKRGSQVTATTGGIYSPFLGNFYINNTNGASFGPNYRNANIRWKVCYNIVDLELGHTINVDPFLKLRPFIGLKGGCINQHIQTTWQNPSVTTNFTSATENVKNNFGGLGPVIGLDTTWSICQIPQGAFNICANFSGALLWGRWRFKDEYENNTPTSVAVQLSPITGAATMARGFMGLEWVTCFSRSELGIRLGYEAQVWFNQMQYYSFNMGRLNNLMSLHGGVLSVRFNF